MTLYLHKILPILFLPSGFIILLVLFGLLKRKPLLIWLGLILFYLFAIPVVSDTIFSYVEKGQLRKDLKNVPSADAIVVLGGMFNYVKTENGGMNEWGDPDRFFGGIELYKAGKASEIIFTGAKMPWADKNQETEGESLKNYAIDMGVPDSVIKISGLVTTTEDESKEVKKLLLTSKNIILVTSAFHMPRAKSLFERQGFNVITYPVDSKVTLEERTIIDYLPEADSFKRSETGIRELIGRVFYSLF
ncbi:MAG: YdcF family protein [Chitinophagia bacterium]|jgi:uncharacterized SAM-binding protein YcdF (DUF218 family)|nr:YdcF family protein [Chitinophagia bacterium]